ncbi:uncharacterized protein LOC102628591 [Citrus sinensis]|nr:uncharacterized protein LOC18051930 isoform X2 [Citrus x clementina]XP_024950877.2 uncharacterized protein LOC102628591 [Citrus sinensis]XP_052291080.1 uncharacterized protein LOC102628591 [Citrus sinensis]XP_052291081.1 uncharacterized protein LOC102628591 [Citrus sinensis]XP_052291082.1 uncharacterized protein LOC102628591 [Citrus sinensis]XP_052291083.1 uncharacterized protein LOC102628591 [Citrus sinensis]XP_052291084.1 uncharacterized protein LOC102628591 [Citrus sinensis]XP_05229108
MAPKLQTKIKESEFFPGKITCLSTLRPIENIKLKLTERQEKIFKNSCFGHFIDMKEVQFSSHLCHKMLLREVSSNDYEMHFLVGGSEGRFSMKEFALITGLNCGKYPRLDISQKDEDETVCDALLNGETRFTNQQLEKAFLAADTANDMQMVKLAMLYFLECVLLGKERKVLIDTSHIHMVDHFETFNNFPWGRKSFNVTLSGMRRALKNRVQKFQAKQATKPTHKEEKYSLLGFPYSFQVWAYEAISVLTPTFAQKEGHALPRILNWKAMSIPKETQLEKEVFSKKTVKVYQMLNPTKTEKEKAYMQCWMHLTGDNVQEAVAEDDNELQLLVSGDKDGHGEELEELDAYSDAPSQKIFSPPRPQKNAELGEIKNQLDRLEEKVDQILQLLLAKKSLRYQPPFQLQESVYGNNTMRRKSKKRKRSSRAKNVVMTDIRGNDLVVSENGGDNLEMTDSL